jgi:hypothetical protein
MGNGFIYTKISLSEYTHIYGAFFYDNNLILFAL